METDPTMGATTEAATSWERLRAYLAAPPAAPDAEADPDAAPAADGEADAEPAEDRATPPARRKSDAAAWADFRKLSDRLGQSRLVERVASWHTPGGLFPLIMAILFFLFAIIPVNKNGDTRLFLIWQALTGGVQLPLTAEGVARQAEIKQAAVDDAAAANALQIAGKVASVPFQVVSTAASDVKATIAGGEFMAQHLWESPLQFVEDVTVYSQEYWQQQGQGG